MKPLRILHLTNDLSDRGNGIINAALDIATSQRYAGHAVAFAAGGGGYEPFLKEHGIQHYTLDQTRSVRNLPLALLRLRAIIAGFEPDILHAHMRTGLVLARLLRPLYQRPVVAHLHNVAEPESRWMRLADRVIVVSVSVGRTMQSHGIPRHKIRAVLNGMLNTRRIPRLSEVRPHPLMHPAILTVAGMYLHKGIAELLMAFATIAEEFTEAHLYLVGDGPDRALFEAQADTLPCRARIHFEGFQPQPQAYMRSADVFVLASRRDSFGLVLIEAREAGCAIVASDVDGIPEALNGGTAGMLVPPQNAQALAEALRQMLRDPSLRDAWGRRASENLAGFSVERMASEVTEVYRELLPEAVGGFSA
jgi:glycosyltransferase involved in cell wall biosynthesis